MKSIFALLMIAALVTGCKDYNTSELETPAKPDGDGRVICYNDDGTEFFNEVGSFVNTLSSGFTAFTHLPNHPDYNKGRMYFTPAWRCIVEDW